MTKFIRLESPVFIIKDFDLALGSFEAYLQPDFRDLIKKRAIILKCVLKNAMFLQAKEKIGDTDTLFAFFGGKLPPLLNKLVNVLFETINTELRIFADTVEFSYLEAYSKDIKVYASGSVSESGSLRLRLKIFFSPEIASQFPEELTAVLTEKSNGWLSYYIDLESEKARSSLKLESDRFRLEFKQVETH